MDLKVVLAVPVMVNFKGYTELMQSVDIPVRPYVFPNWEDNRGVSVAWNESIDNNQDADVLIIANDDIIFEPNCLQFMVNVVRLGQFDVVTAVNTRDFPNRGDCNPDEPDYACFAIDPVMFRSKYGYFDENFSPAYFEDNDMARRIHLSGGKQVKCADARMFHKGSQTQFWNGEDNRVVSHEMFRNNQGYYIAKWGGMPGEERFLKPFGIPTRNINDWTRK